LSLELCGAKALLGRCDEGNSHHPCSHRQIAAFHHGSALNAGSEFTARALKGLLVFKPVVFSTAAPFAMDTLFYSLILDE